MKSFKYLIALAGAALIGFQASALTIGDSRDLGLISPNHPANPTSSASFIDILLGRPLNSGPTTIGANEYTRTGNDPLGGSYPSAVYGDVEFGGGVTSIDLGAGGYLYLLAKYDGPNWGSQVWYVGGLTGIISIPANGTNNQYGVSHTFLYNPQRVPPPNVPDGGVTLMLLGSALTGLGLLRRKLSA